MLVFSQYIETRSAAELLSGAPAGVGYLLKDRVADVGDFVDAIGRVAAGGTVLDPEVVRQLLGAARRADELADAHSARAAGAFAPGPGPVQRRDRRALTISLGVVEKHLASIFAKLGLAPSDDDNRRVIAAIKYLES